MESIIIKYELLPTCKVFINKGGVKEEVSRVIYPLFIITGEKGRELGKNRLTIVSVCSFFQNCENNNCYFSRISKEIRDKKKEVSQNRRGFLGIIFSWLRKAR